MFGSVGGGSSRKRWREPRKIVAERPREEGREENKEEKDGDGKQRYNSQRIKEIDDSNRELQALMTNLPSGNAGNSKSEIFYDDFNKLKDDIIAGLPVSKITMAAPDGSKLGSEPFSRFGKQISLQIPEQTNGRTPKIFLFEYPLVRQQRRQNQVCE